MKKYVSDETMKWVKIAAIVEALEPAFWVLSTGVIIVITINKLF